MTLLNLDPEQEWKKKFPLNIFMQTYTNEILIHYRATSRERDVTHVFFPIKINIIINILKKITQASM